MANEITVQATISGSKGGAKITTLGSVQKIDMAGDHMKTETQEVGTSDEELVQPTEIGTLGLVWIKNLDATNYVEYGLTSSYTGKLKAGEENVFRAAGSGVFVKADTASCNVQYAMFED